jgi:hypothetical protein
MPTAEEVRETHRWAAAAAILFVAVVFLLPARADLLKPVIPMEEGSVLVYPDLILHGEVPNRDFETMYGPGNLWLLSGSYALFGTTTTVERTVGLLYRFGLVAALFMIGRRSSIGVGVACALIAVLLTVGTWAVAYAWFGGLALATWSLWTVTTKRWLLIGGVLGGLALVFRPDLVLAVGALVLVSRRWRFLGGVALGALPYLVLVAPAGPRAVFEGLVVDPVFRINPGRRFPIPWDSPLLWLVVAATCLLVFAGVVQYRRTDDTSLVACAFFALGLFPYALQRADAFHLASAGCVAVALSPLALRVVLAERARGLAIWVSCLCVVLLAWGTAVRGALESVGQSFGLGPPPSYQLTFNGRSVPLPLEEQVSELSNVLAEVDEVTRPGARIFVGPDELEHPVYNDTFLYYLVPDLVPASYYLEMNPGTADRPGSRLRDDVASADVLLLTSRFDDWIGSTSDGSSVPEGFCARSSSGPWQVLVRCSG